MFRILLLGLLIYSFWNISIASTIFIVFASIFNIWIYSAHYLNPANPDPKTYTENEIKVIKKYHLFFRFPFVSKYNSSASSAIYIFGALLVLFLFYHTLWLRAFILLTNTVASALMAPKLNPIFHLHDAVERQGKHEFKEEMLAVDSAVEKIYNYKQKS